MPPLSRPLPEEVIEEILLRLPPHEPACLVRASLASKPWRALLSSARFRGRYRKFHGAPPMLGFLASWPWGGGLGPGLKKEDPVPPFMSTTKFCALIPDHAATGQRDYGVWDCRHGRVLLGDKDAEPMRLAVWDPMTGRRRELQEPGCMVVERRPSGHLGAAVLCAISGCDHRACHEGPSRVVFFSLHDADDDADFVAQACVASLEMGDCSKPRSGFNRGEWSEPSPGLPIESSGFIEPRPPVLVKDAIHFMLAYDYENVEYNDGLARVQILKYNLSSICLSLIDAPSGAARNFGDSILMALEDGTLGFARWSWKRLNLYVWSRQTDYDGVAAWTRRIVISLKIIFPVKDPEEFQTVSGSIEGSDIIFVSTNSGIYKMNLKTLCREKIWNAADFSAMIPYMSFYNP